MLTDDWMRRRWLEACDSTAIPLGAFKAIARVIEAEIAAKTGKSPVARVREHGDFQATVDWLLNPLPDGTELFDTPVDCPKCDEWRASEHKLSEAYLRIRQKLNAFDTPHGPTADQVYEHTEAAIDALQAKVAEQSGEIERLEKEVVHRQSLLRESNRNCAERAGIIWERNVTIAQQAVLIKKCEKAMPHNYVRMIEALAAIAEAKP